MAKRRPSYLILVTGKNGLELFSAHHTPQDAEVMRERLSALVALTGAQVHVIEVPQKEGMVKGAKPATRHVDPPTMKSAPITGTSPNNSVSVTIPATQEEFDEQTRQMLRGSGPRDGYRDDTYTGAFS